MVLKRALPVLAMLLVACPGSLDPNEFGEGGACADVPVFLASRCGTSGCHTSNFPAGNLDLVSPNVSMRVINVTNTACGGPLGDPMNPDKSVMIKKLKGTECGTRMPLGQSPLKDSEIDCIRTWIAAGGK